LLTRFYKKTKKTNALAVDTTGLGRRGVCNDFYRVPDVPDLGFRNRRFQSLPFRFKK
jgi:hypothetical protein